MQTATAIERVAGLMTGTLLAKGFFSGSGNAPKLIIQAAETGLSKSG